jgi:hypothetical protein
MSRSRATYQEIRKWVLQNYGFEPETSTCNHEGVQAFRVTVNINSQETQTRSGRNSYRQW